MRNAGGPGSRVAARIRGRGDRDGVPAGRGRTPGRNIAATATRGAVLIGLAVVIGSCCSRSSTTPAAAAAAARRAAAGGGGTVTTTATTGTDGSSSTTADDGTPAGGGRPASQVVVQVLNGSGVQGAANQRTNDLKAKGYQVLPAGERAGTAHRHRRAVQGGLREGSQRCSSRCRSRRCRSRRPVEPYPTLVAGRPVRSGQLPDPPGQVALARARTRARARRVRHRLRRHARTHRRRSRARAPRAGRARRARGLADRLALVARRQRAAGRVPARARSDPRRGRSSVSTGSRRWSTAGSSSIPASSRYLARSPPRPRRPSAPGPDLLVERKGEIAFTIHWRDRARAGARRGRAGRRWRPATASTPSPARMACELRPPVAGRQGDRGRAALVRPRLAPLIAFAGDDQGDLSAFDLFDRDSRRTGEAGDAFVRIARPVGGGAARAAGAGRRRGERPRRARRAARAARQRAAGRGLPDQVVEPVARTCARRASARSRPPWRLARPRASTGRGAARPRSARCRTGACAAPRRGARRTRRPRATGTPRRRAG